jgi:hypothetical protein
MILAGAIYSPQKKNLTVSWSCRDVDNVDVRICRHCDCGCDLLQKDASLAISASLSQNAASICASQRPKWRESF